MIRNLSHEDKAWKTMMAVLMIAMSIVRCSIDFLVCLEHYAEKVAQEALFM